MKRKYNLFFKAAALLFVILIALLPSVQAAAEPAANFLQEKLSYDENVSSLTETNDDETTIGNETGLNSLIIAEDESKRDSYTKHFLTQDGSYIAAQYSYPIHFQNESGEWVEYDNTLIEQDTTQDVGTTDSAEILAENNEKEFKNKTGNIDVRLSKFSKKNNMIKLDLGNNKVSWGFKDVRKTEGIVANLDEKLSGNDKYLVNTKMFSEVKYPESFKDVDLQYIVTPVGVKENIILKNKGAQSEFTIEYRFNSLTAKQKDDRTIELFDKNGKCVYVISAPCMTDSKGKSSTAVTLKINEFKNNKLTLTLSADKEWLVERDREFPVVIDPSFNTGQEWQNVQCTYVDQGHPSTAYGYGSTTGYTGTVYVGTYGSGNYRTYIKMNSLPVLCSADMVIAAKINLAPYGGGFFEDMPVYAYEPTANWQQDTVTWNNQPSHSSEALDYMTIYSGQPNNTWKQWDITAVAKKWYTGGSNYGIVLMPDEATSEQCAGFVSSNYPSTMEARPIVQIAYRNAEGLEGHMTYTTTSAGIDGSLSVNNYNGNVVAVQNLGGIDGLKMPVSLSLIYNQSKTANNIYCNLGKSWKLNCVYFQIETNTSIKADYPYYIIDADGTKHHFIKDSDGKYKDEDGLGYTLTKTTNPFEIEDKSGNKMTFDYYGHQTGITDTNGNTIKIEYNSNHHISSITDGAGRKYNFTYNSSKYLTSITFPNGKVYSFTYATSGGYTNLTKITYPDGTYTSIVYDGKYLGPIKRSTDSYYTGCYYDGSGRANIMYTYSGGILKSRCEFDYKKVNTTRIKERDIKNGSYQSTYYADYDYQFNNYGQTVGIVNQKTGQAQYYEFGAPGISSTKELDGTENKLISSSKTLQYVKNFIINPPLTAGTGFGFPSTTGGAASYESTYGNGDSSSAKVNRTSSAPSPVFTYQTISGLAAGDYTVSAYFSTKGSKLTGTGGIIRATTGSSSIDSGNVQETASGEWVRRSVTINVKSGEALTVYAGLPIDSTGTVYIDDFQVEKGICANNLNLMENSDFSKSTTGWTGGTRFYESGHPQSLSYSLKLAGNPTSAVNAYRTISVKGNKGDTFTYGAWLKGSSAPTGMTKHGAKGTTTARLRIEFYNSSGTKLSTTNNTIDLNCGVTDWQYLSGHVIAPAAYSSIRLYFDYDYNVNSAQMTGVYLNKDNFGQSYTYDKDGNVVSSKDLAEANSTFAYQNNMLSKIVNPTGSQYLYAYDSKNNLTYATSTEGQSYKFDYDSAGNTTKSTLYSDNKPVSSVTSGKYYVIRCVADGGVINSKPNTNLSPIFTQNYNPDDKGQVWYVTAYDSGFRFRSCYNTGYSLDLKGGGTTDGTKIQVSSTASTTNQQFTLTSHSGDPFGTSFTIKTKTSGKCIAAYADTNNRTTGIKALEQRAVSSTSQWQRWYFYEVSNPANGTQSISGEKIVTSATYANQNYLSTTTDALDNVTKYNYNSNSGLLTSTTDPRGTLTSYAYNNSNQVTSVTSNGRTVNYSYDTAKRLAQISHNDGKVAYGFDYDSFGRRTGVTLVEDYIPRDIALYTYDDRDRVTKLEYGNDVYVNYSYDNLDRISKKTYNGSSSGISYDYDAQGNLSLVRDSVNNLRSRYEYDSAGRLSSYFQRTGYSVDNGSLRVGLDYRYENGKNRLSKYTVTLPNRNSTTSTLSKSYSYSYGSSSNNKDKLIGIKENGTQRISYEYDGLGRITKSKLTANNGTTYEKRYTYTDGDNGTSTVIGNLTNTYKTSSGSYNDDYDFYFYDENGNITAKTEGLSTYVRYEYDKLNQLVRENDPVANTTTVYTYDNGGNMLTKKTYAYTLNSNPGTPIKTETFGYLESWEDVLISYNGTRFTIDWIGNPLKYRDGMVFTWKNGRNLATVTKNGSSVASYDYDMDGIRLKKTAGSYTTQYYYADGMLLGEYRSNGAAQLVYLYDANGEMYGFTYKTSSSEKNYYYVKNLQGDVVGLLDDTGVLVAKYRYDAWGKPLSVTDASGTAITSSTNIANINPIRYRGYYYDTETGFYYLQSRYYDPMTCRFLNADAAMPGIGGNILGYNLFTYCMNNPVNMSDYTGNWPSWSQIFTGIAIAAVAVAAIAVVVATAGAATPVLAAAGGGIISAGAAATAASVATGAMIVAGVSATAAVVISVVDNTNYQGPTRDQTVYKLVDNKGDTKYVGRTNNPTRRANEHKNSPEKSNLQMVKIASGLTKIEARAMEQVVISAYTLDNLINARREIAVGNVNGFAGKIGNVISIFGGAVEDEFLNLMGR